MSSGVVKAIPFGEANNIKAWRKILPCSCFLWSLLFSSPWVYPSIKPCKEFKACEGSMSNLLPLLKVPQTLVKSKSLISTFAKTLPTSFNASSGSESNLSFKLVNLPFKMSEPCSSMFSIKPFKLSKLSLESW